MRYADDDLSTLMDREDRAERFLDGLQLEREALAAWGTDAASSGSDRQMGLPVPDAAPGRRPTVSWGAPTGSADLVHRASESLQPAWERPMLVGDVMHGPVASVPSATALTDVAALMHGLRVPWVVVESLTAARNGDVVRWHVISDVDLLRATTAGGSPRTAGSIASLPPLCIDVRDDLAFASAALLAHERPCAMVVENGLPAGLVSACDITAVWSD